jgi:hypothetical protein
LTPAALRQLAAALRGPPTPGENLRAADALDAAAEQLDTAAELRVAAEAVVNSYDAGDGPRWPAVETLKNEVVKRHARRGGAA